MADGSGGANVGVRAGRTHNRIRRGTVSSRPSPRHVRDVLARRRGESPPRRDPRARARRARRARLLANAESSANASCRTGDECDADDAFPDGSSSAPPIRHPHRPSAPPPPVRHPRRAVRRRPVGAIHASRFERDRNLPRHLFRPLPFLPDPDASSSAPSQWAPTSLRVALSPSERHLSVFPCADVVAPPPTVVATAAFLRLSRGGGAATRRRRRQERPRLLRRFHASRRPRDRRSSPRPHHRESPRRGRSHARAGGCRTRSLAAMVVASRREDVRDRVRPQRESTTRTSR